MLTIYLYGTAINIPAEGLIVLTGVVSLALAWGLSVIFEPTYKG